MDGLKELVSRKRIRLPIAKFNTDLSFLLDGTVNKEVQPPATASGHQQQQQHIFLLQQLKTDLNLEQLKGNGHYY